MRSILGSLLAASLLLGTPFSSTAQNKAKPNAKPVNPAKALNFGEGEVATWIWGNDSSKSYRLRTEFDGGVKSAWLKASCDNQMILFLNGEKVAESAEWTVPVEVDVTKHIKPGLNELLAEVKNIEGPAGFVLKLILVDEQGKKRYVTSNDKWKAAELHSKEWKAVKSVGKYGSEPWGDVFAGVRKPGKPDKPVAVQSGKFNTLPGFEVEKVFTVPKNEMGSWVSLTTDDQGRLLASDQGGQGVYRITPAPIGSSEAPKVEKLDLKISSAQGMLFAFGNLYLSVNGGPGSGLYRAKVDGDKFGSVEKLKAFQGGGEHGPHALRLSPDGKSIYVVSGNHTKPPEAFDTSRVPKNWDEDHLLPRQWDGNGHAAGILAPGGWIARTDPDGKTWDIVSIGYRNAYSIDFNADGELFAYDSDMEWDMGMPWYRPTRVTHATVGSEFGWRSGTGKWPAYYLDSLPPLIDIGPGSPVGIRFGYGTKFPAKYQKALYLLDWTFGTMYAIHLQPAGATYKAVKEEFVSRTPLPLTDATIGKDGALYFTIGGRGNQSELYRVVYTGTDSTDPADAHDQDGSELRALRRKLEELHAPAQDSKSAIDFAWQHLGHEDRFIRYAARVALEHQPAKLWEQRVLQEKNPLSLLTASVALARQADKELKSKLLSVLDQLDFAKLSEDRQLDLLRVWSLVFIRMGGIEPEAAKQLSAKLDPLYPSKSEMLNRELCMMLVYLKSPTIVSKTIAMMKEPTTYSPEAAAELLARNPGYGGAIKNMLANHPETQKVHYAFQLRNAKEGWKFEERTFYFRWLSEAQKRTGGASYVNFLKNIDKEAYENANDVDRLAIESTGVRKPWTMPAIPKPVGPGRMWKMEELLSLSETKLKERDFKNGKQAYSSARCVVCHRFANEGGATGPDLTQLAGRFGPKEVLESIVEPSKVISDQYRTTIVATKDGKIYTGRILLDEKESLTMLVSPEDPTKISKFAKQDIEEMKPSSVSLMPADLLHGLNENEVLDLLAYLLSRGNPNDARFKK